MGTSRQQQNQTQNVQTDQTQQQQQDVYAQQHQMQQQQQATSGLQQFMNNFANQNAQQENVSSTGVQTTGLSPLQQPVASQYFQDLMRQYTGGGLTQQPYTGERVAAMTPAQLQAQQMAQTYATGQGTGFANDALVANQRLIDPRMLDPSQVPGLQALKQANTTALTRNLTENQLPLIRNEALVGNNYGGSAQGIAEGLAVGRTNEGIANANAGMDMAAYQQGLQAMQAGLGLAPQTAGLGAAPAQLLSQVGQQQQTQQQAQLGAQEAQFREAQAAPSNTLAMLQQLMGVQGQYGGTQTGTQVGTGMTAGTQSGQSSGQQLMQQLSAMLGISAGDSSQSMSGTQNLQGTQNMQGTNTQVNKPSTLQNIGALAGLAMMPWTFGLTAPKPQIAYGGGMY